MPAMPSRRARDCTGMCRAIQNGFDAFFTTAATLIDDLSAAATDRSRRRYRPTHPAVLIVDEVGYLTYGTDAANMLFDARTCFFTW